MRERVWIPVAAVGAVLAIGAGVFLGGCSDDETTLSVMSYNIYGGGANEGKPIDETVTAIEAVDPDIVGIQETRLEGNPCTAKECPPGGPSVAGKIAKELGYEHYEQPYAEDEPFAQQALWANAVLSKYPIEGPTAHDLGVEIDVDGRSVYAFNVHLDDSPYQPYQLTDIPYGGAPFLDTEKEAVRFARDTRGPAIELLKQELAEADDADATFIFGDFNEPSAHDWTAKAVEAGQQPVEVAWPTTLALEDEGFVDAYREVNPDPVDKPAFTWTPTSKPTNSNDHHDRIDFVLARADDLTVDDAAIVGEGGPSTDIVVDPWPSDHRASSATVTF
jgi:endonuclease/exonuclease/phosphatase family metal-dependent hydrolase